MSNTLSIFNQLRPVTVGYDNIFDHFEKMFEDDFFKSPSVNYPPYNIVKTGENQYNVEVALAGYNKKDISIEYADNLLTIKSVKDNSESKDENGNLLSCQQCQLQKQEIDNDLNRCKIIFLL